MIYKIELTHEAHQMLASISDRRIKEKIKERIEVLQQEPEKQGKALTDDLMGYRSLRAVGQRYRIIYKIKQNGVLVVIIAIGIRKEGDKKDIYRIAKRLMRLKLL